MATDHNKSGSSSRRGLAANLHRNLVILAVLSLMLLGALAIAPAKSHLSEWRTIQQRYNTAAAAQGVAQRKPALHQIWRPEIKLTDRCTSCHLGMGAATPLAKGGALFGKHPPVHHDVGRMGCTVCHRGQGRATNAKAAHGNIKHWDVPMLAKPHLQAACGQCHGDATRVPPLTLARKGRYLFELHGCESCHVVDGKGGKVGPGLSGVALKGYDRKWQIKHLRDPTGTVKGSRMMSFGHLTDGEIDALVTYLETLVGAPRLIHGKAVAAQHGCRGCHRIGGVGGDNAPDLTDFGAKGPHELDFKPLLQGPHTAARWIKHKLRTPGTLTKGSKMPAFKLAPDEERDLITYIISLQRPRVPLAAQPKKTRLARLLKRRDFAATGDATYSALCSACHGKDGEGQVMASLGTTVPAVANPDMLAAASDNYLRYTLQKGRPGRQMPSWSGRDGGLTDDELELMVRYLRRKQGTAPTFAAVEASLPRADVALGATLFYNDCAGCHGLEGDGTPIAPSVVAPELMLAADDRYLHRTITQGRPDTAMPAHRSHSAPQVAALIAWLRGRALGGRDAATLAAANRKMRSTVERVLQVKDLKSYRAGGSRAYGRVLFTTMCSGCHGSVGQGGVGPAITSRTFLESASDAFLASSILLGRSQRPMRPFGPDGIASLSGWEVGDLIAYLRHQGSQQLKRPLGRRVQGTAARGQRLFHTMCSGCHGRNGEGRTAPALRNAEFLRAATDGFLQATIARGRRGTAMRAWTHGGYGFAELEPKQINDIVAFIRSWQRVR